ncbi:MAG TPA: nucleotidyltransferase [Chitinophaga sp.]|uniref:nucleotidyltransferase n=1 Tax=Chitinophaga sp. TaxID=1869181 RepID=UPI002DB5989A|nr:nucleotidyltransferase [Chitinophaga sp.]HEU4551342.1 nucleotidyltransferase [Chitinophaga sp.]
MIPKEHRNNTSHVFYKQALLHLQESGVPFMLGGAFAMFHYTGIYRDTKDLDIFCSPKDYPSILKLFAAKGYRTELTDVRWLAKVFSDEFFIDIIFASVSNIFHVEESWFEYAPEVEFVEVKVRLLPPEELIYCKIYVQNRERFDGADINHILLRYGKELNWQRLLDRLDQHWHLLLAQLLIFQFVYPADYQDIIPKWLLDDLIRRTQEQYELPAAVEKVCRGPMIDQTQYQVDVKDWDYKSYTIKTV